MKKFRLAVCAGLTVLGAAGLGVAGPAMALGGHGASSGPEPLAAFAQIDANGDGKVTPEEMTAFRAAAFARRDTNGDGFLSRDEMSAAALARIQARIQARISKHIDKLIARKDADGDGQISLAEISDGQRAAKLFKRLDKDGDGAISTAEVAALKERLAKRPKHGPRDGAAGN